MKKEFSKRTAGQLRKALLKKGLTWKVHPRFKDTDKLPIHATGGLKPVVPASKERKIAFKEIFSKRVANPWLAHQHITNGYYAKEMAPPGTGVSRAALGQPLPRVIDWRNRWGWPWITTSKDQSVCANCWAFAGTALVESMARIEHCVWATRSEGDTLNSANANCGNSGGFDLALNSMRDKGSADPDCVPWIPANTVYHPTIDREGRTVKFQDWKYVQNIEDQKDWLENVGPLVSAFYVWGDFPGIDGVTVYIRDTTQTAVVDELGWHALLIVGFDDTQNAWIVKNSWGDTFGDHGFALVGYGECEIDTYAKAGLQGTNVDPWTKRRLHNGNILEGDTGAFYNDFELFASHFGHIKQWRRLNSAGNTWQELGYFANDLALFRPTIIQSTYNRNLEMVYLNDENRLRHFWYSRNSQKWNDGGLFGPPDASGIPGFIQSNYDAPGNFEVVVRTRDGRLSQWWREGGSGGTWVDGGKFARNVAFSGASLIQSSFGTKGDFYLVCVLDSGVMQEWRRDNDNGGVWKTGATFGSGIVSPPCMIESQYGAATEIENGNFELCVAVNGQVQHWWRANSDDKSWRFGGSFGHDVFAVTGLLQSSFGFALEVVVIRYDFMLQHYWRDGNGWHEGPVIGQAG